MTCRVGPATGEVSPDLIVVLVLAGIAAVLVVLAFPSPTADDERPPTTGSSDESGTPTPAHGPPGAPDVGQYVLGELTPGGELQVTHWIISSAPVDTLTLRADQADGRPGTLPALNVEVTAGREVLAAPLFVDSREERVSLGRSMQLLRLAYRIDGVLDDDTATLEDRALANVTALNVDYVGESGPVRRVVMAPGEVLNVACLRTDSSTPRPCGAPLGKGWQVDLEGVDRDDGLLVQLQLG
jgi:hypothetical protein